MTSTLDWLPVSPILVEAGSIADTQGAAYEILFSFHSPESKAEFLGLIRSNQNLGNDYADNDLMQPTIEDVPDERPLGAVLPARIRVTFWIARRTFAILAVKLRR